MTASRIVLAAFLVAASALLGCGHAPPVTGSRAPGAQSVPDYPEVNCAVNNTVDCRPGSAG